MISLAPANGLAVSTEFTLTVSGFEDENTPILYKFAYYSSPEEYE